MSLHEQALPGATRAERTPPPPPASLTLHPTILHRDGGVGLRGSWEGGITFTAVIS